MSEINIPIAISIGALIVYMIMSNKSRSESEYNSKIKMLDQIIYESKKDIKNKIKEQEKLIKQTNKHIPQYDHPHPIGPQIISNPLARSYNPIDPVNLRDRAVMEDPLYPPLARMERPLFDQLAANLSSGVIGVPTRGSPDTYRMVGYLVNGKDKGDNWKLFGRQKYPGSSQGEYYAVSMDDKKFDMKITIKDDMMPKDKIRDIYALPNEVQINSPLFSSEPYKLIELEKADLASPYL